MRVVTLANVKGGVGKSTICSALAVRAAEGGQKVAMLDLDGQETLSSWWVRRGRGKNPKLIEVDAATEAIELLLAEGWHWALIDTGPAKLDSIEPAVAVADLVLIPTRPSAFDIEQAAIIVEMCENHGKKHAFVLNAVPSGSAKLLKSSVAFLRQNGFTVLDPHVAVRTAYAAAVTVGKSGPEVDKSEVARREIDALWEAVLEILTETVPA
jgi:ATPases involved in chromosome partitioning